MHADGANELLTAAVLPAPLRTQTVTPADDYTLSSANTWGAWPGLSTTVDVPAADSLVLLTYQVIACLIT